jgi:hypothetical protein
MPSITTKKMEQKHFETKKKQKPTKNIINNNGTGNMI